MDASFPHLGLRAWPFRVVPEPEFCDFLADRAALRTEVNALIGALETRPTSTIHLVWSWYGAGKTHTLFYLANRCVSQHTSLLPIYTECPRDASGFVDLYRSAINQLRAGSLVDAFGEYSTRPGKKTGLVRSIDPDLEAALTQALLGGKPTEQLLNQWLQGHALPRQSLRDLAVSARVDRSERCSTILGDSILVLTDAARHAADKASPARVVWIVDEIQRVGDLSDRAQTSILSGLVGVFNRCPVGLTIIVAYSGEPNTNALPDWIPPDLGDRIGKERPLLLPPLRSDEAKLFVKDLLTHFRLPSFKTNDPFFPFTAASVEALLSKLGATDQLKPRTIMQFFDVALRDLEPQLKEGSLKEIDEQCLLAAVQDLLPMSAGKGKKSAGGR